MLVFPRWNVLPGGLMEAAVASFTPSVFRKLYCFPYADDQKKY